MSTPRCFNRHTSLQYIFNCIICSFELKPTTSWAIFPLEPTPMELLWDSYASWLQGKRFTRHFFLAFMESLSWYEVMWWWLMEWNTVYPLVSNMHVWLYVHVRTWCDVNPCNAIQGRMSVFFCKDFYNGFKHYAYILEIYWNVPIYRNIQYVDEMPQC